MRQSLLVSREHARDRGCLAADGGAVFPTPEAHSRKIRVLVVGGPHRRDRPHVFGIDPTGVLVEAVMAVSSMKVAMWIEFRALGAAEKSLVS